MTPSNYIIHYQQVAEQVEDSVKRLVGFVRARNLLDLIDAADLDANPRSAKVGSVTDDIIESIEQTPELFPFKTKGILLAASECTPLDRSRYRLVFANPASEGILDGGHNTLAIGLHILKLALVMAGGNDKPLRKVRRWADFKPAWLESRPHLEALKIATRSDAQSGKRGQLDFLVPVETLVPAHPDRRDDFAQSLLEISAARNNNVQLTVETRSGKKGHYEHLKGALPPELARRVEWRTNDGGTIKVRDLLALAWIPLSLARLPSNISIPAPQTIYSSKGECAKAFDVLMDHSEVSTQGDIDGLYELHCTSVGSALGLAGELPDLFDMIYEDFPNAYNNNGEGRFGRLTVVKQKGKDKGHFLTPYYMRPMSYNYPEGFIVPLVYALRALMTVDTNGQVKWKTDPKRFVKQSLPSIVSKYRALLHAYQYDPQKVGKANGCYTAALDWFETELIRTSA